MNSNTEQLCKELAELLTETARLKAKEYRPLCGVCHRAPSAQNAQDMLLASSEKVVEVCSCTRGVYRVELEFSTPTCLRVIHTYQLHDRSTKTTDTYSI